MRKLLTVLLLALSVCVLTGSGQIKEEIWALMPANCKAHIDVHGYRGSHKLSIQCFFNTVRIMNILVPDESMELLVNLANERLEGQALAVFVASYGSEYFWPTSFKFTQGFKQFSLSYRDVLLLKAGSAFSGGKLLEGTITNGYISLPADIDVTKPFKIWYDNDYAQLGPWLLPQPGATSTEQATPSKRIFLRLTNLNITINPGDAVMLRAETLPQADCNITVYYKSGLCESSGLQPQKANENGIVYWAWRIDPDLEPGTVLIQVTAALNGETVTETADLEIASDQ